MGKLVNCHHTESLVPNMQFSLHFSNPRPGRSSECPEIQPLLYSQKKALQKKSLLTLYKIADTLTVYAWSCLGGNPPVYFLYQSERERGRQATNLGTLPQATSKVAFDLVLFFLLRSEPSLLFFKNTVS